jgi:hypothetical protein
LSRTWHTTGKRSSIPEAELLPERTGKVASEQRGDQQLLLKELHFPLLYFALSGQKAVRLELNTRLNFLGPKESFHHMKDMA